jgi:hypothetical protein
MSAVYAARLRDAIAQGDVAGISPDQLLSDTDKMWGDVVEGFRVRGPSYFEDKEKIVSNTVRGATIATFALSPVLFGRPSES